MKLIWHNFIQLFKPKVSPLEQTIEVKKNDVHTKVIDRNLSQLRLAIEIINKYFYSKGRFNSRELHFFIQIEGFELSLKQVYKIVNKLTNQGLLSKTVIDSHSDVHPFYNLTEKYYKNEN